MAAKLVRAGIVIVALATGTTAAQAQDAPPQEVAAATPTPQDEGGFVDKAKRWADEHRLLERLNGDVDGWYPRLGGMTRGSGFALGPGYRTHFGNVLLDVSAGLSMKVYKTADVKVRWLQAMNGRAELWTTYRYEDFPQEDFFGTGQSSSKDARTSYDFDSNNLQAIGFFKPAPWLQLGVSVGYMAPDIGEGSDANYPSIEQVFTDAEAPGLLEQPRYLHTTLFADLDYRDQPGRPRSGGLYHVAIGSWNDRTLERYDFKRFDANFSQYYPFDRDKKHVVLGRLGLSYVNNEPGSRVPFYFLAYVGGVDTIRSFNEFRFKDENALWMTAEYNYTLMKWVSLAAFVDAGKVSANWEDIRFADLRNGYGFGVRVHSNRQTFARVDVAGGGGEGWSMFLKLGPSF